MLAGGTVAELQAMVDQLVAKKDFVGATAAQAGLEAELEATAGAQVERSTLGLNELQPIVADCVAEKNYDGGGSSASRARYGSG